MKRELTSLQHPIVKHLMRLNQSRDYRRECQSVVIEGRKMVQELGQKQIFKSLLVQDSALIPSSVQADEVLLVNEAIIKKITGMKASEGIIAEAALPNPATLDKMRFIIACDGISDPGNLGTLLRTALGLGWEGAFILENSCDPFNDKALRAAKGATFNLPLAFGSWDDLSKVAARNHLQPFVADLQGKTMDEIGSQKGVLLVLSNEARGPSQEALEHCQPITIPLSPHVESLNVAAAGAILMYLLRK